MANSTPRRSAAKPGKPHPDFPLTAHVNGTWCKKIRGRVYYFGPWRDPEAALQRWLEQRDDLLAGRKPGRTNDPNAITLAELANKYLTQKRDAVDTGEITSRTFRAAHDTCARLIDHLGRNRVVSDLLPEDFAAYRKKLAAKYAASTVNTDIAIIRAMFNWGFESMTLEKPVRVGPGFKTSQKAARRQKAADNGLKMFEADEVRQILEAARPTLRAMVLLGVNAGFGNHDIATLPKSALDLKTGWVSHMRPKTGAPRRCPLWCETVEAIRVAIEVRPAPKDPANDGLVFITTYGNPWVDSHPSPNNPRVEVFQDSVSVAFKRLLAKLSLQRPGRGFYALRHTHRTISDEVCDPAAAGLVMGHVDPSMAGVYRERIADERLRRVADHVHAWLFPEAADD